MKVTWNQRFRVWLASAVLGMVFALGLTAPVAAQDASAQPALSGVTDVGETYRLGSGDKVRLTVFGENDLSGEFQVDSQGAVALPLIGSVQVGGHTLREIEALVRDKLKEGYLKNPQVSCEVLNYRPFYILGEVAKAGQYPFQGGLTVMNAVAIAGGFSDRADKSSVTITRGGRDFTVDLSRPVMVLPGDVVKVPERIF